MAVDVLEPAPDPVDCRIPQNKNRPGGTPRRGGFFCSSRGRLASIRLSDSGSGTYKRNRPIAPRADFTILLSFRVLVSAPPEISVMELIRAVVLDVRIVSIHDSERIRWRLKGAGQSIVFIQLAMCEFCRQSRPQRESFRHT